MPEELSFKDKIRTLQVMSRTGQGHKVREFRRPDGVRVKQTRDDAGHVTTEHATKDDRVDVHIRNPEVIRGEGIPAAMLKAKEAGA